MSDKPLLNVDVIEERIRRNRGRVMFPARPVPAAVRSLDAAWLLAILIGIGLVGVLLAVTDRLSDGSGRK
jgi:hypothetical protein